MPTKVIWVEYEGGFLGILPCNVATINVNRLGKDWGHRTGMFRVTFANRSDPEFYWSPEDAKVIGILLARRTLTECLMNLEVEGK
jgi:hypothetical protein